MAGQLARLCAAFGIATVLAGCSPTAAPQNKGSATAPVRRATSRVTRGADQALRQGTKRGGYSASQYKPARTGSTFFGLLKWPKRSTNPGTAAGTTKTATPTRAVRVGKTGMGTGAGTGGLGYNNGAGMSPGVGTPGVTGASRTRNMAGMGNRVGFKGAAGTMTKTKMTKTKGTKMTGNTGLGGLFAGSTTTTNTGGTPLHVIAFFTVDTSMKGFTALGQDPKAVSYLAPWWYSVQSDGSLKDMTTPATKQWVTAHKLPVAPLITNGGQYQVLMNDTALKNAATNITNLVKQNNYAGVNIDFQGLPGSARSGLNALVDDLSMNLRPMGKTLTVDIIPTQSQTGTHGAYDEVTLAKYADQIILMTYDHHDNTSPPGPVSPHDWVVNAVKHTLQVGVPANKIILGVNTYGYDWNTSTGSAYTVPQKVARTAASKNKHFDAASRETKVAYSQNGQQHVAYYPGHQAIADKIAIAKKYGLYGIAIWKVGYESSSFWQQLVKMNGYASTLHNGNATNSGVNTGAAGKGAPSAASKKRPGGIRPKVHKPITHRPIGTRSGRHNRPMRSRATKMHRVKQGTAKKGTKG